MEKNVGFKHEIIDLKNKPPEFIAKYRQASGGVGSGLVPLLEHGGDLVIESDVVAKYVAQEIDGVGGMGEKLYPKTEEDMALIETFLSRWQYVTDTYYDFLRSTSQKEADKHEIHFFQSLGDIDDLLRERTGAFILGDFSYAECMSAPWIQRFFVTLPHFRCVDFENEILERFDFVSSWMKAVCNRQSCLASRCPDSEMIASANRYYVSFLSKPRKKS